MVHETAVGPDHLVGPELTPADDPPGLSIRDPIENAVFRLHTDQPVSPTPVETDHFCFPIDTAARIHTARLVVPVYTSLYVRDIDGELLRDCTNETTVTFDPDRYLVEISSAPMKLYLVVDGDLTVERTNQQSTIRTSGHVDVGVRSFHEHPAGTITVTDDPHDTLDALSYLGSGLKTHSPERSFPTLRGHPPLIERGDEFAVPSHVDKPETGITLVVPPTRDYAYPVASLAYYLGADVVPGENPRLVADGREFALPRDSFQTAVDQTLEHLVFLDCLTRAEGYYQVDLYERAQVEDALSIPYRTLYDAPLDVRTAEYLSLPYDDLAPTIPQWDLTADVEPDPENVEALPFLADRLAKVRVPDPEPAVEDPEVNEAVADIFRSSSGSHGWPADAAADHIFTPIETDSMQHVFFGDGFPLGTSKGVVDAYRRRLDNLVPDESNIQVHVVCNAPEMTEEGDVESVYGTRDYLDFDVHFHEQLTTDELADVLREPADFLHYIGHIEPEGFYCADGCLDANSLDTVNVKSFLLNACHSYEQGMALIENGSLGGIGTVDDVVNVSAVRVGRALARLLNHGFPLQSALALAKRESVGSNHYTVFGVGSLQLVQYNSGAPQTLEIESITDDHIRASFQSVYIPGFSMGSIFTPDLDVDGQRFLHPGSTNIINFDRETFETFLATENIPVKLDGELYWSGELLEKKLTTD